jgi:hypothetical protein
VTLYLLADLNVRLRPKLLAELRPGARVVSHEFDMGDWPPDSTRPALYTTVYLWTIPARVAGGWAATVTLDSARLHYTLALEQQYQQVMGLATRPAARPGEGTAPGAARSTVPVAPTRIRGDSIELRLAGPDRLTLAGRVIADTMRGVVRRDGGRVAGTWVATRTR